MLYLLRLRLSVLEDDRIEPHRTGVVDPDLYVFGPPGSGSFHQQAKKAKKNLDFYYFFTSLWPFVFDGCQCKCNTWYR
jgi:hypothetical protein